MQQSSLLLRQDLKDCCDTQTLGIDTLRYRLPFASALHTETATVGRGVAPYLYPLESGEAIVGKRREDTVYFIDFFPVVFVVRIRHRHTKIPVAFRIGASHRNSHRHKGAE